MMKIKTIYLASPYNEKDKLQKVAQDLEAAGFEVTSRWLCEEEPPFIKLHQVAEEKLTSYAYRDVFDVLRADMLIFFAHDPTEPIYRGGSCVEMGIAIGRNKHIFVVGPQQNIFHYLEEVRHFATWEDCLAVLANKGK